MSKLPVGTLPCNAIPVGTDVVQAPRQVNTWSPCAGSSFNVRCGPNYAKTGSKAPSEEAIYETYAVDVYSSPKKLSHMGSIVEIPPDETYEQYGLPSTLVLNFMIPDYPPPFFGKKDDGEGWNLTLYATLSDSSRQMLASGKSSPALDLVRQFMNAPQGAPLRKRCKCIFGLANVEETHFDTVLRGLISKYNAKPFMARTSSSFYQGQGYFEIDIDCHRFGTVALNGLTMLKSHFKTIIAQCGLVIEAEKDSEMPEQMLACINLVQLQKQMTEKFPGETLKKQASNERFDA